MAESADSRPHLVIVGAGFGGLEAAHRLKGAALRVTLIDRRNHHLFQPLLYQVATAGLSPADIAMPIRSVLRDHDNVQVLMDEATGIDLSAQELVTRTRRLKFDYLLVATGSTHAYFGHDEWRERAPGLKTLEDATTIRARILQSFERAEMATNEADRRRLLTFVLVGAGPTGVELAGALAELARRALARDFRAIDPRSARILLIEAGPRVLPSFPLSLSAYTARHLREIGVEILLGSPVESVTAEGIVAAGARIEAETVIWCAGVQASPVGRWLGVPTDAIGRVSVAPDLSVPGHSNLFVIGDAAAAMGTDGKPLAGFAPVAKQQGAFVAELLRRRLRGERPSSPFRYREWGHLATIGRSAAVADFGWLSLRGLPAWLAWSIVHVYFLIGFRNRLIVFINWAWAYVTFGRGARLITGDAPLV